MTSYLVTSLGVSQFAMWTCVDCQDKRARVAGQDFGAFRETAAAHIRETGHALTLFRGTQELLAGDAWELPERKAITS